MIEPRTEEIVLAHFIFIKLAAANVSCSQAHDAWPKICCLRFGIAAGANLASPIKVRREGGKEGRLEGGRAVVLARSSPSTDRQNDNAGMEEREGKSKVGGSHSRHCRRRRLEDKRPSNCL